MFRIVPLFISLVLGISSSDAVDVVSTDTPVTMAVAVQAPAPSQDKKLGPVNLCDSDGIKCEIGDAYQDPETSRIYVIVRGAGSTKYYAQKSNKSYWTYMIRFRDDNWLYFSF